MQLPMRQSTSAWLYPWLPAQAGHREGRVGGSKGGTESQAACPSAACAAPAACSRPGAAHLPHSLCGLLVLLPGDRSGRHARHSASGRSLAGGCSTCSWSLAGGWCACSRSLAGGWCACSKIQKWAQLLSPAACRAQGAPDGSRLCRKEREVWQPGSDRSTCCIGSNRPFDLLHIHYRLPFRRWGARCACRQVGGGLRGSVETGRCSPW